uniref:Uncharacterized protein n=1 Tax=Glossina morsitans morsitans TaxID=37546 RepID=A0A1B0GC61_GLOMM
MRMAFIFRLYSFTKISAFLWHLGAYFIGIMHHFWEIHHIKGLGMWTNTVQILSLDMMVAWGITGGIVEHLRKVRIKVNWFIFQKSSATYAKQKHIDPCVKSGRNGHGYYIWNHGSIKDNHTHHIHDKLGYTAVGHCAQISFKRNGDDKGEEYGFYESNRGSHPKGMPEAFTLLA